MSIQYENQAWLDNWLRLKAKAEQKDFNNLASVKEKVRTIAFVQQKLKRKVIIEDYPELTQLNLSNNELEEIIIRNCPDLKLVSLGHNKLTKLTIENCPSVQEIYTHNNQLTKWDVDVEDLKNKNLRTISYSDNPLTSEEKTRLDALGLPDRVIISKVNGNAQTWLNKKYPSNKRSEIKKIDLSELSLCGSLSLSGFTNLEQLDVSDNKLTELVILGSKNLKEVYASNNKISKAFFSGESLEKLCLEHNKLTTFDTKKLKKLKELSLTANDLKNLDLKPLTELEVFNCSINKNLVSLDLTNSLKLKCLYCYSCKSLKKLEVNHLKELENLFCYKNSLSKLDLSNLKKLKELNCANNNHYKRNNLPDGSFVWVSVRLRNLKLDGCESLEILDCAENGIQELNISNFSNLIIVSCKESSLRRLDASNCPKLSFLDYSRSRNINNVNLNGTNNLKELYYSKSSADPDWKAFVYLEKLGIGEEKLVEYEDEKTGKKLKELIYFVEEIDILSFRNTERIKILLADEDSVTLEELDKLTEKDLKGIPNDLKKKLLLLGIKKINEKFKPEPIDEGFYEFNDDSEEKETIIPLEKNELEKEEQEIPIPTPENAQGIDYKTLYFTLLNKLEKKIPIKEKIAELQKEIEKLKSQKGTTLETEYQGRNEFLTSKLEELIKQEQQDNINQQSTNFLPLILGGLGIILIIGVFSYLLHKKKKNIPPTLNH